MGKETALPKNIRQIGDIRGREKICMEDYVMTYIKKKEPEEEKGYLGIFLGEKKQMEDSEYIFIRGILEVPVNMQPMREEMQAEEQKNEEAKPTDGKTDEGQMKSANEKTDERQIKSANRKTDEETLAERIQKECRFYFPDWEIQGCCIIGTYPADRMEELIHVLPETANLLYHLQEQEENLYRMVQGQYQRVRGYLVFYEQNKLMQEYMAEVFGDKSVEKESQPDRAIRNFREKVAQKSEQKSRSMLKLAGSFFVVTVLVVGAVVVNRMEDIQKINSLTELEREMNLHSSQDLTVSAQAGNGTQLSNTAVGNEIQPSNTAAGNEIQPSNAAADNKIQPSNAAGNEIQSSNTAASNEIQPSNTAAGNEIQPSNTAVGNEIQLSNTSASNKIQSSNGAQLGIDMQVENTAQLGNSISTSTDLGAAQNASSYANADADATLLGSAAFWEEDYEDAVSQDNYEASTGSTASIAGTDTNTESTASIAGADTSTGSTASIAGTDTNTGAAASIAGTDTNTGSTASIAGTDTNTGAAASGTGAGTSTDAAQEVASMRQLSAAYVIKVGDTLADICSRYYGSLDRLEEICEVNGIDDANRILPGQKIVLP